MIQVTSSAFSHNGAIPPKYTCDGENVSPPLAIAGIPDEAKSLVLIMDDPDAPAGTWTHWTVWNINPMVSEIEEGSVPVGAGEGTTSFGKPGYGGPCPPSGTHRYFFKIFALDTMLDLAPGASRNELEKAIEERILDQGEIVGHYSR
ncbi:MAG: YbhB/YbcL family Raf kinase inhibitor-like protein [Parcubacteria group bacterium]|nr:YbhB/YbcL family Raf kinase inhibitor-like protein [Parcubacteria group bacterium]